MGFSDSWAGARVGVSIIVAIVVKRLVSRLDCGHMIHSSAAIADISIVRKTTLVINHLRIDVKRDRIRDKTDVILFWVLVIGLLESRFLSRVVKHDHVVRP